MCCCVVCFFFFKQKTAYEMRISDWSSDVCSSDLLKPRAGRIRVFGETLDTLNAGERSAIEQRWGVLFQDGALFSSLTVAQNVQVPLREHLKLPQKLKIGRASCRERVCQYV